MSNFFIPLISMGLQQWKLLLPTTLLGYICLVSSLRFQRVKSMHEKFHYPTRESFSKMTVDDAYAIHNYLVQFEFPKTFSSATAFSLFKAYGIPSISRLLVATGQLANGATASKRYADTGALLLEAVLNPQTSERATTAIARINYLHDRHRKSGKITESDLLYTLSLFALEPSRWVSKYEWRELTEMELCALGTLWKSMGDALKIPYAELPSYQKPDKWKNGLEWLDEVKEWSRAYEEAHMVPAISNKQLADSTLDILLWKTTNGLRGVGKNIAASILDDRLRASMMIDDPPPIYHRSINWAIKARKVFLRYLSLPRWRRLTLIPVRTTSGRLHLLKYRVHPWYIQPTFKKRWGLSAWMLWYQGGALPGDEGAKYVPEGFLSRELGPSALIGKGLDEVDENVKDLMRSGRGGCPFAVM